MYFWIAFEGGCFIDCDDRRYVCSIGHGWLVFVSFGGLNILFRCTHYVFVTVEFLWRAECVGMYEGIIFDAMSADDLYLGEFWTPEYLISRLSYSDILNADNGQVITFLF